MTKNNLRIRQILSGTTERTSNTVLHRNVERFSYYGMRAILMYYIYDTVANGGLGLPKATALAIMSIYGSMVFMSSIIGGWVSDRVLGSRKTVLLVVC